MAKNINFAVVGLGMGGHHCRSITEARGASLVAVCDSDAERTTRFSKQYGARGYIKWEDLLKDRTVDCINVCVESGKHADFGIAAAKAGKHIIIEKPVDVTPARIAKLQDVVNKTGVKAGCIFQLRVNPCNLLIKKAIDKGKLGRLIGAHASLPWFRSNEYYSGLHGTWRGTWKWDGGGALTNQGIHTVDVLQWLAGPVHSVCGFSGVFAHKIEAEDYTVAILKFENGALGTLYSTTCCRPEGAQRLYLFGSTGSFSQHGGTLDMYEMGTATERKRMMETWGPRDAKKADAAAKDPMAVATDGHTIIIQDMVKAIREDRDPLITIESAKHSVEIAYAIFKSSRTGKEVPISAVRA